MNIVLIGYRGTGKSTVAALLAQRLGWAAVSTDAEIVRRQGRPIPEMVAQHGWDYFRDREAEVCLEVGGRDQTVIDTGGGAILRDANVQALKKHGRVIWLTADVSTIARRIGGDTQRPSLTGTKSFVEEIEDVLAQRLPKYQAAADVTIETDSLTPAQISDRVLALVTPTVVSPSRH